MPPLGRAYSSRFSSFSARLQVNCCEGRIPFLRSAVEAEVLGERRQKAGRRGVPPCAAPPAKGREEWEDAGGGHSLINYIMSTHFPSLHRYLARTQESNECRKRKKGKQGYGQTKKRIQSRLFVPHYDSVYFSLDKAVVARQP